MAAFFSKSVGNFFKSHQPKEIRGERTKEARGEVREVQEVLDLTGEGSRRMEGLANGTTVEPESRTHNGYGRHGARNDPQHKITNATAGPGPSSLENRALTRGQTAKTGFSPYAAPGAAHSKRKPPGVETRTMIGQDAGIYDPPGARANRIRPDTDSRRAHPSLPPVSTASFFSSNGDPGSSRNQVNRARAPLRDDQTRHMPQESRRQPSPPVDDYVDIFEPDSQLHAETKRGDRKSPDKSARGGFGSHQRNTSKDLAMGQRTSKTRSKSPVKPPPGQSPSDKEHIAVQTVISSDDEVPEPVDPPKSTRGGPRSLGTRTKDVPIGRTKGEVKADQQSSIAKVKARATHSDTSKSLTARTNVGNGSKAAQIPSSKLQKEFSVRVQESWISVDPIQRLMAYDMRWDNNTHRLTFSGREKEIFIVPLQAIRPSSQFCQSSDSPVIWLHINRYEDSSFSDQLIRHYALQTNQDVFELFFMLKEGKEPGQMVYSLVEYLRKKLGIGVGTMPEINVKHIVQGYLQQEVPSKRSRNNNPRRAAAEAAESRRAEEIVSRKPRQSRSQRDGGGVSDASFEDKENKKPTPKRKPKSDTREPNQSTLTFKGLASTRPQETLDMVSADEEVSVAATRHSKRNQKKEKGTYADQSDDEVELSKAPEQVVIEPPVTTKPRPDNPAAVLFPYPLTGRADINITEGDKWRVEAGDFLNDTLIEFGLKHVISECKDRNPPADVNIDEDVYLFNSFFYQKLSVRAKNGEKNGEIWPAYNSVKKWTKGKEIFKKKYLIIPINENAHWYLAVIVNPAGILRPPEISEPVDEHPIAPVTRAAASLSLAVDEDAQDEERASDELQAEDTRSGVTSPGVGEYKDIQRDYHEDLNDRDPDDGLDILGTPSGAGRAQGRIISSSPDAPDQSFDVLDSIPRTASPKSPRPAKSTRSRHAGSNGRPENSSAIDISASPEPEGEPEGQPLNSETLRYHSRQNSGRKDSPQEAAEDKQEDKEALANSTSSSGKGKSKENLVIWDSEDTWIITFDSLGGAHKPVDRILGKWLQYEAVDKQDKTRELLSRSYYREARVPSQPNYSDCGLYLIHYVEQLLNRPKEIIEFLEIAIPPGNPNNSDRLAFNAQMSQVWNESETNHLRQTWTSTIDSLTDSNVKIRKERGQSEPDNQAAEDDEDDLVIAASQAFPPDQVQGFHDEGGGDGGGGPDIGNEEGGIEVDELPEPREAGPVISSAIPDHPEDYEMDDTEAGPSRDLDGSTDTPSSDDAFGLVPPSPARHSSHFVLSNSTVGSPEVLANGAGLSDLSVEAGDAHTTFDRNPDEAFEDLKADEGLLRSPPADLVPESQPNPSQVIPPNFGTSSSAEQAYAAADTLQAGMGAFSADDEDCETVDPQQARMLMTNSKVEQEQEKEIQLAESDEEEQEMPEIIEVVRAERTHGLARGPTEENPRHTATDVPTAAGIKGKGRAEDTMRHTEANVDVDVASTYQQIEIGSPINLSPTNGRPGPPVNKSRQLQYAHETSKSNERMYGSAPTDRTNDRCDLGTAASANHAEISGLTIHDREDFIKRLRDRQPQSSGPRAIGSSGSYGSVGPWAHHLPGAERGKLLSHAATNDQSSSHFALPPSQSVPLEPAIDPSLDDLKADTGLEFMLRDGDEEPLPKAHIFGSDDSSSPRSPSLRLEGFPKAPAAGFDIHASSSSRHIADNGSSSTPTGSSSFTNKPTDGRKSFIAPAPIKTAFTAPKTGSESPLTDPPPTTDNHDRHHRSSSSAPELIEYHQSNPKYSTGKPRFEPTKYTRPRKQAEPDDLSSSASDEQDEQSEKGNSAKQRTQSSRAKGVLNISVSDVLNNQDDRDTKHSPSTGFADQVEPVSGSTSARFRERNGSPHPSRPADRRQSLRQGIHRSISPNKELRTGISGETLEPPQASGENDDQVASTTRDQRKKLKRHTSGSGSNRTDSGASISKRPKHLELQLDDTGHDIGNRHNFGSRPENPTLSIATLTSSSTKKTIKLQSGKKKPTLQGGKPRQTTIDKYTAGDISAGGSTSAPARTTTHRAAKNAAVGKIQEEKKGSEGMSMATPIELDEDD